MASARHGKDGMIYLDCTALATGTLTLIPLIAEWSIDSSQEHVEVTSLGDTNKQYVSGLRDFKGTASGFMDADTDAIYTAADGVARDFILYPDRYAVAGKRRYSQGKVMVDVSESGGVGGALKVSISFMAAGDITRVYGV